MKLKLLIAALAICSFTITSKAQIDATINPIGLLFGDFNVGADFVLSDNISVEASVGFGVNTVGIEGISQYKWTGIPITAVGKYYFNPDDGADGFYADVFIKFISRSYKWDVPEIDDFNYDYTTTRFGIGVGAGYKVVSNSGIVFEIGLGVGRALLDKTKYEDETLEEFDDFFTEWIQIMFNGKLAIGYRFGG